MLLQTFPGDVKKRTTNHLSAPLVKGIDFQSLLSFFFRQMSWEENPSEGERPPRARHAAARCLRCWSSRGRSWMGRRWPTARRGMAARRAARGSVGGTGGGGGGLGARWVCGCGGVGVGGLVWGGWAWVGSPQNVAGAPLGRLGSVFPFC